MFPSLSECLPSPHPTCVHWSLVSPPRLASVPPSPKALYWTASTSRFRFPGKATALGLALGTAVYLPDGDAQTDAGQMGLTFPESIFIRKTGPEDG